MAPDTGIWQFVDDDAGYLQWLQNNPDGFTVNSARVPKPNYLMLHKASCGTINSDQPSNWTADYIKTCSRSVELLGEWARQQVGGDLQPCQFCKPDIQSELVS